MEAGGFTRLDTGGFVPAPPDGFERAGPSPFDLVGNTIAAAKQGVEDIKYGLSPERSRERAAAIQSGESSGLVPSTAPLTAAKGALDVVMSPFTAVSRAFGGAIEAATGGMIPADQAEIALMGIAARGGMVRVEGAAKPSPKPAEPMTPEPPPGTASPEVPAEPPIEPAATHLPLYAPQLKTIREISQGGRTPIYHDTTADGVFGILKEKQINPKVPPYEVRNKNDIPTISITRDFHNYSHKADSPYRLVLSKEDTGSGGRPFDLTGERVESEERFTRPIKASAIRGLLINESNPSIAKEAATGRLDRVIAAANEAGIPIERYAEPGRPLNQAASPQQTVAAADPVISVERAGNINLSRINAPEDVKTVIKDVAAQNEEFIGARRGVVSQADTESMAQLVGMTPEKLATRVKGQAFNAEEMFAARTLLVDQASKVRDLAKVAATGSDVDKAAFIQEMTRLVTIQEQVAGATAEAGRALAQFRMMAGKDQISGLVNAARQGGRLDDVIGKINELDTAEKVANFAAGAFKAKTSDMVLEAWINALLSGPQTHATNILSNTLVSLWSIPESAVASGISKVTGSGITARETFARMFGTLEGAKDGIRAGWRAFKTETPSDAALKIEQSRYQAIPSARLNIGGREIEVGGKQIRIPGRFLMAQDEVFKSIAYRQHINSSAVRQALNEGLKGEKLAARIAELRAIPPEEIATAASKFAAKQTFTNPLGPAGQGVMQAVREFPAARFVVPFIRTPVNIVKFAAERSPFAPLFSEVRANLAGANGAAARDEQISRILLGSTVSAVTAYMAAEGHVTGGGPTDPRKRGLLYASGWQPYSIKVGDQYYSYSRLEPLGTLLGVASDYVEIKDELSKEESDNIAALIMGSVSKNLVSKTWLKGPSDLIEAVNDPERYGGRYVQRMVGTLIPTGVAQVNRVQDPYLRDARSALDAVRARIPGQSEKLPVRRDITGQPIKLDGSLGPDLLSPIYTSAAKNDPAISELIRLDVTPSSIQRKINGVDLEPGEFDHYSRVGGELMKQSLDALVAAPAWQQIDDTMRAELMNDAIRKSRDLARSSTMLKFPALVLRIAAEKQKKRK